MKRADPAKVLAQYLADEAGHISAIMVRLARRAVADPRPGVQHHRTTDAEADMICADCSKPFGTTYASLTIGITTTGDEITELICTPCADLRP